MESIITQIGTSVFTATSILTQGGIPSKFKPWIALGLSVGFSFLYLPGSPLIDVAQAAGISWLTSMGAYAGGKTVVQGLTRQDAG